MSNLVMWNLVIGFLLPPAIAVVQQPKWSEPLRAILTFAACVVAGFGTAYFNDQFNRGNIVGSILVTLVAAISLYKGFWKPTGASTKIENATTLPPKNVQGVVDFDYLIKLVVLILVLIFAFWLGMELIDSIDDDSPRSLSSVI